MRMYSALGGLLLMSFAVACNKSATEEQHHAPSGPTEEAPAPELAPAEEGPAAAAAPGEEAPATAKSEAADDFDAVATYQTVCASCHGPEGGGDGPAGAALKPKPADFSAAEFWAQRDRAHIVKVIKEGGPAVGKSPLMAPFGAQFSDAQIEKLADVVIGFKPG